MTIRILIADDHQIVRDGLRSLLEKEPDLEIIGEADDGRKAIELVHRLAPNVIILDVGMPNLNGIDATRRLLADQPSAKVIALSMHSDRRFVEGMLRAGACGYLLKDCAYEELVRAVRTVIGGKTYLSPEISTVLVSQYLNTTAPAAEQNGDQLTGREREVLQLLAEGHSTKEIAVRLHVSAKTVETHRQRIMTKLDLHSIADLTKYAIRQGLTSLDS